MVVATEGVSDDVLAFVSLSRLASGDASMCDVLSLASGLMRELAPTATIGWFVIDDGSMHLAMRHASGPAARQLGGKPLRLGEGVSGWVAANRQVMINSEASLDLGEQAFVGSSLQYALSVPLITRESLVGTITLYSETIFAESQSRLVQVIAPHLAQAIWTARRAEGAVPASLPQASRAANPEMRLVSAR
jgi:GAF domain-containing protein